jgi:hypothetical protein
MIEHLGLTKEDVEVGSYDDPVSSKAQIDALAARNTGMRLSVSLHAVAKQHFSHPVTLHAIAIYEDVFGVIPTDSIRSWKEMQAALERRTPGSATIDVTKRPVNDEETGVKLRGIKGHLVSYPLQFLCEEELGVSNKVVDQLTPSDLFN